MSESLPNFLSWLSFFLKYNWQMKLCVFKAYIMLIWCVPILWNDYRKLITTSITPHSYFFLGGVRMLNISFFSKFQVYNTVSLTIVIMLYISLDAQNLLILCMIICTLWPTSISPTPKTPGKIFLQFTPMISDFPLSILFHGPWSLRFHNVHWPLIPSVTQYVFLNMVYRYNRKFSCFSNSFSESVETSNFEENHFVIEVLRSSAWLWLWTRVDLKSLLRVTHKHTNKKVKHMNMYMKNHIVNLWIHYKNID